LKTRWLSILSGNKGNFRGRRNTGKVMSNMVKNLVSAMLPVLAEGRGGGGHETRFALGGASDGEGGAAAQRIRDEKKVAKGGSQKKGR